MTEGKGKSNGNGKNGLTGKKERTAAKIIAALAESKGLLTLAATRAGVGLTTMRRYLTEYPTVAAARDEAKEGMLDFAESKLYQKIERGDIVATLFYLKTQGKGRGYIERQEFSGGAGGLPIKIEHVIIHGGTYHAAETTEATIPASPPGKKEGQA